MDGPGLVGRRRLGSAATAHAVVVTELDIVLAFAASPEVLEQRLTKGPQGATQPPQHGTNVALGPCLSQNGYGIHMDFDETGWDRMPPMSPTF